MLLTKFLCLFALLYRSLQGVLNRLRRGNERSIAVAKHLVASLAQRSVTDGGGSTQACVAARLCCWTQSARGLRLRKYASSAPSTLSAL